jgi:hypothetical protein
MSVILVLLKKQTVWFGRSRSKCGSWTFGFKHLVKTTSWSIATMNGNVIGVTVPFATTSTGTLMNHSFATVFDELSTPLVQTTLAFSSIHCISTPFPLLLECMARTYVWSDDFLSTTRARVHCSFTVRFNDEWMQLCDCTNPEEKVIVSGLLDFDERRTRDEAIRQ